MRAPSLAFLALVACGSGPTTSPADAGTDAFVPAPIAAAPSSAPASRPSARVAIPAGTVLAGSRPGTPYRRPSLEADLVALAVPAFDIDRHPARAADRSDPLRVSADAAARTCAAAGARLCDELEWERACEGDAHHAFAGDVPFETCVARPSECVASTGVVAPGIEAPEWTLGAEGYVLRGARMDQLAPLHRCDARTPLASPIDRDAAVRCCTGPRPSIPYPTPSASPPFASLTISTDALRAALATVPQLAPYAAAFDPYDRTDAERVYARADLIVDETSRARLADGPLLWSPAQGELVWLLAGRSGPHAILAALYPLADGSVIHAASFVFDDEAIPIALTPVPQTRREVSWTTSVGTAGESGAVRLDEDGVVRAIAH
jgi:hypothetical protein